MQRYWLPTIPYSLVDAINRVAAATGSVRYATLAANGDYNGHHVNVYFNDYRGYHIAEYTWAGRHVLARGSLESTLRAGKAEYDRGARGAQVVTIPLDEVGGIVAASGFGYVPYSEEIEKTHRATWQDARYAEINEAFSYERHGLAPAIGMLANSATVEEYHAKLSSFAEQRARR